MRPIALLSLCLASAACADTTDPAPKTAAIATTEADRAPPSPPEPAWVLEERKEGADAEVCEKGSVLECQAVCEGGSSLGCFMFAGMALRTNRVGIPATRAPLEGACTKGVISACFVLSFPQYNQGAVALEAGARACSLWTAGATGAKRFDDSYGSAACKMTLERAPRKIAAQLAPACDNGNIESCVMLIGPIHQADADVSQASFVSAAQRICKLKSPPIDDPGACGMLKDMGVEL